MLRKRIKKNTLKWKKIYAEQLLDIMDYISNSVMMPFIALLSTILIGNNIVNITATAVGTVLFTNLVGTAYGPTVATVVLTVVVLIFGEVSPKSLAKEFAARGVTVNAVAPGFIETDMTAAMPEAAKVAALAAVPAGRIGHADEVAAAVAFLASSQAAYITGQVLCVDGGMGM